MSKRFSQLFKRDKKGNNVEQTPLSGPGNSSGSAHAASPSAPSAHQDNETRSEILGSLRTVLNLAEKCLDGCPIWGPKAAVAAVSESIETMETALENEDSINDVVTIVQKTVAMLAPSMPTLATSVSSELKSRIFNHVSELESIRASTTQWSKEEKNLPRRLLDARRVAKELESVMDKIRQANELFLIETAVRTEVLVGVVNQNIVDAKDRALLECLRPVTEAFHDAVNAPSPCLEETRKQLISDIFAWFNNPDPACERVFWLNGLAGTGKSSVARTVADLAQSQGRLAATFFFSRNAAATRIPSAIIPTIVYQLALCLPPVRLLTCAALDSDRHVRDRGVAAQAKALLDALSRVTVPNGPFLVVLDALDECHLENGRQGGDAVPMLLHGRSGPLGCIKFLITSRVEGPIQRMFDSLRSQVALHDIERTIVQRDIHHYLKHSLAELARERNLIQPFPPARELNELVRRAGSLFIYAATVTKWISDPGARPLLRLQQVLEKDEDEMPYQHKFLDDMYSEILFRAAKTSGNPRKHECALRNVISTVVLLQEPLHISALAILAGEQDRTDELLPLLSAILLADEPAPVRLFHPSFPEFITSDERCRDERFLVKASEGHLRLVARCLEVMNVHLRENICNIKDPSLPNTEVHLLQQTLEGIAPAELRYACKYWHAHLRLAGVTPSSLVDSLETFCTTHLLHWLELLSLLKELPTAQIGMPLLLTYLGTCSERFPASLVDLLVDAERLLSTYRTPIDSNALHVYHSAMVTIPMCSLWKQQASKAMGLPGLRTPRSRSWVLLGLVLEGHVNLVTSVAFSRDGQYVASGSEDTTLRVWDLSTGTEWLIMHGHEAGIKSVAFSPDGQSIVSGSGDATVRVWDLSTGTERYIMHGHEAGIRSVAFSPDGRFIVSGSEDKMVHVWDASTGTQQRIMHGHGGYVNSVACSPNGQLIVSGANDSTVRVWEATTGIELHTMHGHEEDVRSVAFSPDSQCVVSGSRDLTMRMWDASTGAARQILHGHKDMVNSVVFSPNGQFLVSGSEDKTVRVWDATTGTERHIMHGHESDVTSVAFSPNGQSIVSGSNDTTVHVWDAFTGTEQHIMHGHKGFVSSVAFSTDGQSVVSSSYDCTVRVWDVSTGTERHVMQGHTGWVTAIAFSPDGQFIVSGSIDKTVRVWDATTGTERYIMHGHEGGVYSVVFSPDGQSIVSGSSDNTVRVWDASTGTEQQTMHGHKDWVDDIAFSPDGRSVISGSGDRTVRVWDPNTGTQGHVMHGHEDRVRSVAFSPDGLFIASGSGDRTVRVWDANAGTERHVMHGHESSVFSVAFTSNGEFVVAGSDDGTVCVWDATTGARRHTGPDPNTALVRTPFLTFWADSMTGWVLGVTPSGVSRRLCWLPKQYRGHEVAICGQTVCIGAQNGAVTILDFSHVSFPC